MSKYLRNALFTTAALTLTPPAFAQGIAPFTTLDHRIPAPTASQSTPNTVTIQTVSATYDANIQCDKGSLIITQKRMPRMPSLGEPETQVTAIFFDPNTGKVNASATTFGMVEVSPNLTLDKLCDGPNPRDANAVLNGLAKTLTYTLP